MKASFSLNNGTVVTIEGSSTEVKKLLESFDARTLEDADPKTTVSKTMIRSKRIQEKASTENQSPNLSEIIRVIKESSELEQIEVHILDRSDLAGRVLLPLYIIHKYMGNKYALTSGEISKITADLGVPISQPNVSSTLSGTVKRFVIGDKVRKKGQPVRYLISRNGAKYISQLLEHPEEHKA